MHQFQHISDDDCFNQSILSSSSAQHSVPHEHRGHDGGTLTCTGTQVQVSQRAPGQLSHSLRFGDYSGTARQGKCNAPDLRQRTQEPHLHRTACPKSVVQCRCGGGSRRVFRQFVWLEVGSTKMAFTRPGRAPGCCPIPPTSS
jgi:hypothetical protein